MNCRTLICLPVFAVALFLSERAPADTIVLRGPQDSQVTMMLAQSQANFGGAEFVDINPEEWSQAHGLFRFELPAIDSTKIRSASLTVRRSGFLSNEGIFRLYRLTESWGEGTGDSGHYTYSGEIQNGAANWYDRFHGTAQWSVPGAVGEGSSLLIPTAIHNVTEAIDAPIAMDVTPDVLWWYDNGLNANNFGWVMTCEDTDDEWRYGISLYSNDHTDMYPRRWPTLTINYVPEPSTAVLWVSGVVALMAIRRQRRK